jgi:peptide/nickel transport system permease protein
MATIALPLPEEEVRYRRSATGLKQFLRTWRKKKLGTAAGLFCIMLVIVAIFANVIAPTAADHLGTSRLAPPSLSHPFGTDNLFRDMFSRVIIGTRLSIGIGFAAVTVGTLLGTTLGLVTGYFGSWTDLFGNRALDTIQAFPPLVLAIFFLSIFSPTFLTVSLAIAIIITPATARIVRGSVLSIRELDYVQAAKALGASERRIMLRHVLPNVAAPIIVIASIQIGNAILAEAALSFLSLGVATNAQPSWGKMLQDTRQVWLQAWWTAVIPGLAISFAVLCFNLFGDALRDVLDPRLRGSS